MCGFLYINSSVEATELSLNNATARLKMRGPDYHNSIKYNNTYCFHSRLAIQGITDESNQPYSSSCGRYLLIYNGEIYNTQYLSEKINYSNIDLKLKGDTPLLMELLIRYGVDILSEINGMFAFVFWDRFSETGFASRDQSGIKPLYYLYEKETLIFSSLIKSIADLSLVNSKISNQSLQLFYLLGSVPDPYTIYDDIHSVEPGCYIKFKDKKIFQIRKYSIDFKDYYQSKDLKNANQKNFDEISQAIDESIDLHLNRDVPLSTLLSSGLDSSLITYLSRKKEDSIFGLTIGFESNNHKSNEITKATALAKMLDIDFASVFINKRSFDESKNMIFYSMDSPSIDGINTWFACNALREKGYKMTMSGVGGDELLYGYKSYKEKNKQFILYLILKLTVNISPNSLLLDILPNKLAGKLYNINKYFSNNNSSKIWLLNRINSHKVLLPKGELDDIINTLFPNMESLKIIDNLNYFDSTKYLRNQLLKDSDWASMSNGIELRTPFVNNFLQAKLSPYKNLIRKFGKSKLIEKTFPEFYKINSKINRFQNKLGFYFPLKEWILDNKKGCLNEEIFRMYISS